MNNWALMIELFLQFCLMECRELFLLVGISCTAIPVGLLAGIDREELAMLQHVVLQNLRTEGEKWLA